jgi:hypothetical protein
VTQSAGGILQFSGNTGQQVRLASATYHHIDVTNTNAAGVQFYQTFTVSSFTAIQAGTTIQFAATPSSMTVLSHLSLGPDSGTDVGLRSRSTGTQWLLVLSTGATQRVKNVDVKDSNAGNGIEILANDGTSVNSGNNVHWNFVQTGGTQRYWIATTSGSWSNTGHWATTSGGTGPATVPDSTQHVILDANGLGSLYIDQAVSVATMTISTSSAGGFTGIVDSSSNSITVSSFTMALGTFYARTHSPRLRHR